MWLDNYINYTKIGTNLDAPKYFSNWKSVQSFTLPLLIIAYDYLIHTCYFDNILTNSSQMFASISCYYKIFKIRRLNTKQLQIKTKFPSKPNQTTGPTSQKQQNGCCFEESVLEHWNLPFVCDINNIPTSIHNATNKSNPQLHHMMTLVLHLLLIQI